MIDAKELKWEKYYSTSVEWLNAYRTKHLVRRLLKNIDMGNGLYNYYKSKRRKEKQCKL